MSIALVYRDLEVAMRARLEALLRVRADEVRARDPAQVAVYGRRVGRVAAGAVGLAAGIAAPVTAALRYWLDIHDHDGALTMILLGGVGAAILAYGVGRFLAASHAEAVLADFELSGNVHADIARLESEHPVAQLAARSNRLETASIALPLAAFTLLAPLTIHFAFSAAHRTFAQFDGWMQLSYLLTAHVHAFVAIMAWRLARRLRSTPANELVTFKAKAWKTYLIAVAIAAVPVVLPAFVVAITGLVIPAIFEWAHDRVRVERRLLGV